MNDWKRVFAAFLLMALVTSFVAISFPYYKVARIKHSYGQICRGNDIPRNYQRIPKYPEQAFRLAQGKIGSSQARDQVMALCILRQIGDQQSTELPCQALQDGVEPETAVSCLCSIGTPQAIACLIDSAQSPLQQVRQHSYRALLAVLQGDRRHDLVLRALSDTDPNVQMCAFDHLAGLAGDEIKAYREPLSSILTTESLFCATI